VIYPGIHCGEPAYAAHVGGPSLNNSLSYVPGNSVTSCRRAILNLVAGAIAVAVSGCVGPPVLERQVLGYDEVTKTLDEKLLLLNIARVSTEETIHFTSTSSIAATFNWATTLSVSGQAAESKGTNFLNLNIGGSASENPTFSISPIPVKNSPSGSRLPFGTKSSSSLYFKGVGSTKSCA